MRINLKFSSMLSLEKCNKFINQNGFIIFMGFFHKSLARAGKKIEKNDFEGALEIVANHYHGREEELLKKLGELRKEIDSYFSSLEVYLRTDQMHSHYKTAARIAGKQELLENLNKAKIHIKNVEKLLREISAEAKLKE